MTESNISKQNTRISKMAEPHPELGPADRPWLNNEFFEMIIRKDSTAFKPTDKIIIKDYFCKTAVKPGENYSSDMLRLILSFKTKADENAVSKHHNTSYIVKCMYPEEAEASKLLKTLNVFRKEITMYTETLPAIAEVLKSATGFSGKLMARLLYYTSTPTEMMVMEDLTNIGFRAPNRRVGLDREHSELAFTRLAQMHAASMVLNKKDPKFRAAFNRGAFFPSMPESLSTNFCNGVRQAIKVMDKHSKMNRFVRFYENFIEHMTERGIELLRRVPDDEDQFNVLNHGDFWVTNMMFKYSNSGIPIEVRFIDFQMSTFGNCGLDINYFFFTSVQEQTREKYRQELLKKYHMTLTNVLENAKHKGFIPTFKDLEDKLYEARDIAIMTPCIVLPIVILDDQSSKTISVDQLLDISKSSSTGLYTNRFYIEALQCALENLKDIGFITSI